MSKKIIDEINAEVEKFSPQNNMALAVFSRKEFKELIHKAITQGTLIGYVHAQEFTQERMQKKLDGKQYELDCVRIELKEIQSELIIEQSR